MLIDLLAPTRNFDAFQDPDDPENGPWGFKPEMHNGERVYRFSKYAIRLSWLREHYGHLPANAGPARIRKYARAFIMDLFGSVMFPDKSGDQVPVMYLQFLTRMDTKYNWGQAVLAYLYRQLTIACDRRIDSIAGPLMLLQHWVWSHLHVGRPESRFLPTLMEDPNPRKRGAFGLKWTDKHLYPNNPHAGEYYKLINYFNQSTVLIYDSTLLVG